MNKEFISLIAYFIYGGEKPAITDWEAVYKEFAAHCVLPVAGTADRLSDFDDIPEKLLSMWKTALGFAIKDYFRMRKAGKELTDTLRDFDTVPVIIKGIAAGVYYPVPLYRTYGDVDFLLCGEKDPLAVRDFLKERGYVEDDLHEEKYERHIGFDKDGVSFELHRRFTERTSPGDDVLDGMLRDAVPVKRGDHYTLDETLNGLVLLSHLKIHLCTKGVGMRQVLDFMCYTEKVLTDEFWTESFAPAAERCGLKTFAEHVVRMCEICFGMKTHSFAANADEEICRTLMEEICAAGNFGRKRDDYANRLSEVKIDRNIFSYLTRMGSLRFPFAKKYPVLKPLAGFLQIFHVLGVMLGSAAKGDAMAKGFERKKTIGTLAEALELDK